MREWRQQSSLEREKSERDERRAQLARLSQRASQLQMELTEVSAIHKHVQWNPSNQKTLMEQ